MCSRWQVHPGVGKTGLGKEGMNGVLRSIFIRGRIQVNLDH